MVDTSTCSCTELWNDSPFEYSYARGIKLIETSNFIGVVLPAMLMITAGTLFLMWLGEIINESGIGNGSSIIIFA